MEEIIKRLYKDLNEVTKIKLRIDNLHEDLENLLKELQETEQIKELKNNEIKLQEEINKYIEINSNILDKDKQQELFKLLNPFNLRGLSLIKLLRQLNYGIEYINNDKDWKDIKIIN